MMLFISIFFLIFSLHVMNLIINLFLLVHFLMRIVLILSLVFFVFLIVLLVVLIVDRLAVVPSMRDVMLLHYKLILLLGLFPQRFCTLGTVTQFFEVLVHAIGKHNLSTVFSQGILTAKLTNSVSIRLVYTLGNHLLSVFHALTLSFQLFFLILAFFPLFVCDASHNTLVGLGLAFTFLVVSLFLVVVFLLNLLILLLEKALLEPFFEETVRSLSLGLFLKPIKLLFPPLLMSLTLLVLSLPLLPVRERS